MAQTQKRTSKKKTTKKKSKVKKPKVYIPAYKIIISCAVIITICMALLLFTTITAPSSDKAGTLSSQFTEKTEDIKVEEKKNDEKKAAESKKASEKKVAETKKSETKKSDEKKVAETKMSDEKKTENAKNASEEKKVQEQKKPAEKKAAETKKSVEKKQTPAPKAKDTKPAPAVPVPAVPVPAPKPAPEPAPEPKPEPAPAASKFNFPPAKNGATIVIVIDDAGRSAANTKKYTDLPFPITIAVLPKLPQTKQCAETVRSAGKELILHQPMQAMNLALNPGEGAIKEDMTRAEITATIRENIAELGSGVKGMNNHEGSLITANEVKIGIVLDTCMDMGIYFLDSRTTAETKAPQAALERDFEIFEKAGPYIDNDIDYDKMLKRLRETLDYANSHGKAIVIGHVDKSVKILPKLLSDAYPEMKAAGYRFATPSMLK
ncbi:MAG: divergent polysaccharide deacetylase family protein [Treponema sp.]|nr:divergent polysaccharide deacetylase family protein [Treponema sp.]